MRSSSDGDAPPAFQYFTCSTAHRECQTATLMPVGMRPRIEATRSVDPSGSAGTNILPSSAADGGVAKKAIAVPTTRSAIIDIAPRFRAGYLPVRCTPIVKSPSTSSQSVYGSPPTVTTRIEAVTDMTPARIVSPWMTVTARKTKTPQFLGPGSRPKPSMSEVPVATAYRAPNSKAGYLKT